eukprot:4598488-Prymnesium_polylepis.1
MMLNQVRSRCCAFVRTCGRRVDCGYSSRRVAAGIRWFVAGRPIGSQVQPLNHAGRTATVEASIKLSVLPCVCGLRVYGAADANRARVWGRANDANSTTRDR